MGEGVPAAAGLRLGRLAGDRRHQRDDRQSPPGEMNAYCRKPCGALTAIVLEAT